MNRNKFKRTVNDQRNSQVEDAPDGDTRDEAALYKESADLYERRWKSRIKDHQANWWAVAGVYLIVASIAFVVL
jgi:hypothetical protein